MGVKNDPLETLSVGGRCANPAVHISAADPPGSGCHADLVPASIIPNHDTHGMGAVPVIVTRKWGICPTGPSAGGRMDGIVPTVVVLSRCTVPAAITGFKGRVVPLVAGVLPGDDHILP